MAQTVKTEIQPELVEMPPHRMAVVHTRGAPEKVSGPAVAALLGAVKMVGGQEAGAPPPPLRCRWPNAHLSPKEEWIGIWGIPIPEGVSEVPQVVPGVEVTIETWPYGLVAQVVHVGPYDTEGETVARLQEFIAESGHEISGPHEEEYLTPPEAKPQRTVIRYRVTPTEPLR